MITSRGLRCGTDSQREAQAGIGLQLSNSGVKVAERTLCASPGADPAVFAGCGCAAGAPRGLIRSGSLHHWRRRRSCHVHFRGSRSTLAYAARQRGGPFSTPCSSFVPFGLAELASGVGGAESGRMNHQPDRGVRPAGLSRPLSESPRQQWTLWPSPQPVLADLRLWSLRHPAHSLTT